MILQLADSKHYFFYFIFILLYFFQNSAFIFNKQLRHRRAWTDVAAMTPYQNTTFSY